MMFLAFSLPLTVCYYDLAGLPPPVHTAGRDIAARIFHSAGVGIRWQPGELGCSGVNQVTIRVIRNAPPYSALEEGSVGLAAYAADGFSDQAMIFAGRLDSVSWELLRSSVTGFNGPSWLDFWRGVVLGASVAHELGHLLLGPGSHSKFGIMEAVPNLYTLMHTYRGQMRFDPAQQEQIRIEVLARVLADAGFDLPGHPLFHCDFSEGVS
jgi:hypothetical protein